MFGTQINPIQSILDLAYKLEAARAKDKLNGYDYDRILRELYCDNYGVAKLDDKWKPLALVAFHPKEDYGEGDRLYERIFQFKTYEIGRIFECSFEEFINYPRHVVEHMLSIQRDEFVKVQALKEKARKDAERQVNNMNVGQPLIGGPLTPPQA